MRCYEKVLVKCKTCGCSLKRLRSSIEPSGNTFCSHHCAARYTNVHRTTRLTIARKKKQHAKPICANSKCNKQIGLDNKQFCSPECRFVFAKFESQKYVTRKIQEFAAQHDRIPIKYEMVKLYSRARVGFGSWNKAIMAAGFEPNPVMFAKQHIARDGHRCDSLAEKIVDDWLYARRISHRVNVPYPWRNGMTADFVAGDKWIEIFGLAGEHKRYDELKKEKLKLARENGIEIVTLTLIDVYGGKFGERFVRRGA